MIRTSELSNTPVLKIKEMKSRSIIFNVTLLVAIVSLALFFVALLNGWFGPATGEGNFCCEAARDGLIKQPANTWSNVGLIAVGLVNAWLLTKGKFQQNNNALTRSNFTAICFSSLAVLLGNWLDGNARDRDGIGGELDMLSMYLVCFVYDRLCNATIF